MPDIKNKPPLKTQVTTQAVVKNRMGKILLLRRNKIGGLFTLPRGTVKEGESVSQAAERELHEETGLSLQVGSPIRVWQSNHIGSPLLGIVFDVKETVPDDATITISSEHNAYRWFSFDELMKSDEVDPYIKDEYLCFF